MEANVYRNDTLAAPTNRCHKVKLQQNSAQGKNPFAVHSDSSQDAVVVRNIRAGDIFFDGFVPPPAGSFERTASCNAMFPQGAMGVDGGLGCEHACRSVDDDYPRFATTPLPSLSTSCKGMTVEADGYQFNTTFHDTNCSSNRSYGNHARYENIGSYICKGSHGFSNIASEASKQGLSLSLSSNLRMPPVNDAGFGEGQQSENLRPRYDYFKPKEYFGQHPLGYSKQIHVANQERDQPQDQCMSGAPHTLRTTGPIGPFTGYATILKNSIFLYPAQELLGEFCNSRDQNQVGTCDNPNEISTEDTDPAIRLAELTYNSCALPLSSPLTRLNEVCFDGILSSSSENHMPQHQQRKTRLLCLHQEVCNRHKQYQHQMEMVAKSFKSISGLASATPHLPLALRAISKSFKCLELTISNLLNHQIGMLGEDILFPSIQARGIKNDIAPQDHMVQEIQRDKLRAGANASFLGHQPHAWRPQRGLPERSVAILRAWLFDHFLHPYPSDMDKHMLASQTGLSRNQVSNWFINARVRLWKPMVEEVHMLEMKALSMQANDNSEKNGLTSHPTTTQPSCLSMNPTMRKDELAPPWWSPDKKMRMEVQTQREGSPMNVVSRNAVDISGLGHVSLTLGLKNGVDHFSVQPHGDMLRRSYGGHLIQDYVG